MSYIIRRAIHSDAERIIESHERSVREICSRDYSVAQIDAWLSRKLKANHFCDSIDRDFIWVVEINNCVKGYGHLALMSETSGEIMGLYFCPEASGLGAGNELISLMKQVALQNGIKEIGLHSTLTAKAFYSSHGFKQVGEEESIEMQGLPIPCFFMKLV